MRTEDIPSGCIVVGVDAAAPTARAIDWAAEQAVLERRDLLLVHGSGSPMAVGTPWASIDGPDPLELYADLTSAGRALLARATTRIVTRHPSVVVHQLVRPTDARQALLDASGEAAMVVVGSRGRGHVLSLMLGSVSEEVAGRSTCPVVIVRPRHDERAEHHGVLVGTDGHPESDHVVRFAFEQAYLHQLPLTVIRTMWDVVAASLPAHVLPAGDPEVRAARDDLAAVVAPIAALYPEVAVTLSVGRGLPADCLLTIADQMDLVVVGHHERGLLGRLTHGSIAVPVLEHASVPVAIVPIGAHHPTSA